MPKSLLTGPLPDDRGARMAVFAARDVLKKWTETRVDQAVGSIETVVQDWKRDNDVTGLQSVMIDTIDVLGVIAFDQNAATAINDLPVDELIALAILKEAEGRPHVATKGGAFLAAYTVAHTHGLLERLREAYESEWLPNIQRGVKIRRSAAKGHEVVHGTQEEKDRRWAGNCEAYDRAFAVTGQKTLAKEIAAERRGFSVKTIERSLKMRREGTISHH